jgi:hypothetical protein
MRLHVPPKRRKKRNNPDDLYLDMWFAGAATDLKLGGNPVRRIGGMVIIRGKETWKLLTATLDEMRTEGFCTSRSAGGTVGREGEGAQTYGIINLLSGGVGLRTGLHFSDEGPYSVTLLEGRGVTLLLNGGL